MTGGCGQFAYLRCVIAAFNEYASPGSALATAKNATGQTAGPCYRTVIAVSDTPNHESHDRCRRLPRAFRLARRNRSRSTERTPRLPSSPPTVLPHTGEGRFLSRWPGFHSEEAFSQPLLGQQSAVADGRGRSSQLAYVRFAEAALNGYYRPIPVIPPVKGPAGRTTDNSCRRRPSVPQAVG